MPRPNRKPRIKRNKRKPQNRYNKQYKYLKKYEYADNYKKPNILREANDHLPHDIMNIINGYADLVYCDHCEGITGCQQGFRTYVDIKRDVSGYELLYPRWEPHKKYSCCTFTFPYERYNSFDIWDLYNNHTRTAWATLNEIMNNDPAIYNHIIVFNHIKYDFPTWVEMSELLPLIAEKDNDYNYLEDYVAVPYDEREHAPIIYPYKHLRKYNLI